MELGHFSTISNTALLPLSVLRHAVPPTVLPPSLVAVACLIYFRTSTLSSSFSTIYAIFLTCLPLRISSRIWACTWSHSSVVLRSSSYFSFAGPSHNLNVVLCKNPTKFLLLLVVAIRQVVPVDFLFLSVVKACHYFIIYPSFSHSS